MYVYPYDCRWPGDGCELATDCGCGSASATCHNGTCRCTNPYPPDECGDEFEVGGGCKMSWCGSEWYHLNCDLPTSPPGHDSPTPGGPTPTPPPIGYLSLISKVLPSNATCDDLAASTNYLTGTQMTVISSTKTQDATATTSDWTLIQSSFPVTVVPPVNYFPTLVCWTYDTLVPPTTFLPQHDFTARIVGGQFLKGYFGFSIGGNGWTQTVGGDTYAATSVSSKIPVTAPQAYFSANGPGGYPGLLTYGSSFDVSLNAMTNGAESGSNTLSTTRWNASATNPTQSLYDHFTLLLGGMVGSGDPWDADGELSASDFSGCVSSDYCFFSGNPTINNALTIGANEKRILVINGALTIKNTITITPGGFFAIIAKDGITIDSSVGAGAPASYSTSITPQIQGMYITGGNFSIPASIAPPDKQLVLKGMFVADNFSITRSLSDANNLLYPATMFIHDPSLLFSTPFILQEVPFRWQEVAP
jgi:hypothetical protein